MVSNLNLVKKEVEENKNMIKVIAAVMIAVAMLSKIATLIKNLLQKQN